MWFGFFRSGPTVESLKRRLVKIESFTSTLEEMRQQHLNAVQQAIEDRWGIIAQVKQEIFALNNLEGISL